MINYKFIWISEGFSDDQDQSKKACLKFNDNEYLLEDVIHLDELLPHLLRYSYTVPQLFKDLKKLYEYYGMPDTHFSDEIISILESDPLKHLAPPELLFRTLCKDPSSFPTFNVDQSKVIQTIFLRVLKEQKSANEKEQSLDRFTRLLGKFPQAFLEQNLDAPEIKSILWKSFCHKPEHFDYLLQNRPNPKNIDGFKFDLEGFSPHPKVWNHLLRTYPLDQKCKIIGVEDTIFPHFVANLELINKNPSLEHGKTKIFDKTGQLFHLDDDIQQKIYNHFSINDYLNILIVNKRINFLLEDVEKFCNLLLAHPNSHALNHKTMEKVFINGINQKKVFDIHAFEVKKIFEILKAHNQENLIVPIMDGFKVFSNTMLSRSSSKMQERITEIMLDLETNILKIFANNSKTNKLLKL